MSEKYKLDKKDLVKIGKGALIALGGALLTYLAAVFDQIDLTSSPYAPLLVALGSVLVNAGLKWLAGKK